MKKLLIIILCLSLMVVPASFNASSKDKIKSMNLEEALEMEGIEPLFEKYEENDKQVPVYLFMGQGEEKSVAFLNFLNSIYNEYGSMFKLVAYEVGSNPDNSKLMDNVIDYIHSEVTTVPMILMGDVQFTTYDEDINENFINAIKTNYEAKDISDKVQETLVKYYRNYDLMIWIMIILVFTFAGFMVYASLKDRK